MELAIDAQISFQTYLFSCFVLGLLLTAKCLLQMALPQSRSPKWVEVLSGLAALVLAFLLGIDVLSNGGVLVALHSPLREVVAVGLGLTFVIFQLNVVRLHAKGLQLALQPAPWIAVALTIAAANWSSQRYRSENLRVELDKTMCFTAEGELDMVRGLVAITDRGRPVELCRWNWTPGDDARDADDTADKLSPANCHGWVFTSGECFVSCSNIERILEDNGYEPCLAPAAGDLIVYRNSLGEITHSGLVTGESLWGTPTISSKWGLGRKHKHLPEEQPYGNHFTYYHSARNGHSLAILATGPGMSIASR